METECLIRGKGGYKADMDELRRLERLAGLS